MTFEGTFNKGGMGFQCYWQDKINKQTTNTKKHLFYNIEDSLQTIDKNTLAGTLLLKTNKKAPILIANWFWKSKSGRRRTFQLNPLLCYDDFAKKKESLRLDDRGIGGSSKGANYGSTENFATDITAAVNFFY
jgi:hypothetical protein